MSDKLQLEITVNGPEEAVASPPVSPRADSASAGSRDSSVELLHLHDGADDKKDMAFVQAISGSLENLRMAQALAGAAPVFVSCPSVRHPTVLLALQWGFSIFVGLVHIAKTIRNLTGSSIDVPYQMALAWALVQVSGGLMWATAVLNNGRFDTSALFSDLLFRVRSVLVPQYMAMLHDKPNDAQKVVDSVTRRLTVGIHYIVKQTLGVTIFLSVGCTVFFLDPKRFTSGTEAKPCPLDQCLVADEYMFAHLGLGYSVLLTVSDLIAWFSSCGSLFAFVFVMFRFYSLIMDEIRALVAFSVRLCSDDPTAAGTNSVLAQLRRISRAIGRAAETVQEVETAILYGRNAQTDSRLTSQQRRVTSVGLMGHVRAGHSVRHLLDGLDTRRDASVDSPSPRLNRVSSLEIPTHSRKLSSGSANSVELAVQETDSLRSYIEQLWYRMFNHQHVLRWLVFFTSTSMIVVLIIFCVTQLQTAGKYPLQSSLVLPVMVLSMAAVAAQMIPNAERNKDRMQKAAKSLLEQLSSEELSSLGTLSVSARTPSSVSASKGVLLGTRVFATDTTDNDLPVVGSVVISSEQESNQQSQGMSALVQVFLLLGLHRDRASVKTIFFRVWKMYRLLFSHALLLVAILLPFSIFRMIVAYPACYAQVVEGAGNVWGESTRCSDFRLEISWLERSTTGTMVCCAFPLLLLWHMGMRISKETWRIALLFPITGGVLALIIFRTPYSFVTAVVFILSTTLSVVVSRRIAQEHPALFVLRSWLPSVNVAAGLIVAFTQLVFVRSYRNTQSNEGRLIFVVVAMPLLTGVTRLTGMWATKLLPPLPVEDGGIERYNGMIIASCALPAVLGRMLVFGLSTLSAQTTAVVYISFLEFGTRALGSLKTYMAWYVFRCGDVEKAERKYRSVHRDPMQAHLEYCKMLMELFAVMWSVPFASVALAVYGFPSPPASQLVSTFVIQVVGVVVTDILSCVVEELVLEREFLTSWAGLQKDFMWGSLLMVTVVFSCSMFDLLSTLLGTTTN